MDVVGGVSTNLHHLASECDQYKRDIESLTKSMAEMKQQHSEEMEAVQAKYMIAKDEVATLKAKIEIRQSATSKVVMGGKDTEVKPPSTGVKYVVDKIDCKVSHNDLIDLRAIGNNQSELWAVLDNMKSQNAELLDIVGSRLQQFVNFHCSLVDSSGGADEGAVTNANLLIQSINAVLSSKKTIEANVDGLINALSALCSADATVLKDHLLMVKQAEESKRYIEGEFEKSRQKNDAYIKQIAVIASECETWRANYNKRKRLFYQLSSLPLFLSRYLYTRPLTSSVLFQSFILSSPFSALLFFKPCCSEREWTSTVPNTFIRGYHYAKISDHPEETGGGERLADSNSKGHTNRHCCPDGSDGWRD
jgi:hypothetical protein